MYFTKWAIYEGETHFPLRTAYCFIFSLLTEYGLIFGLAYCVAFNNKNNTFFAFPSTRRKINYLACIGTLVNVSFVVFA